MKDKPLGMDELAQTLHPIPHAEGLWQAENSCQLMKAIANEVNNSNPTTLGKCHPNPRLK